MSSSLVQWPIATTPEMRDDLDVVARAAVMSRRAVVRHLLTSAIGGLDAEQLAALGRRLGGVRE